MKKHLLLVDDEAIVGMEMESHLRSLGYSVIGPLLRLQEAMDAVNSHQDIDGAILDINVRGGLIYPVAEILVKKGIPFILVTGYSLNTIREEFRKYPMLHKPFNMVKLTAIINVTFGENCNA